VSLRSHLNIWQVVGRPEGVVVTSSENSVCQASQIILEASKKTRDDKE
jgi:hypothetical protein